MPGIVGRIGRGAAGAIAQSHVDVPMILTSVPVPDAGADGAVVRVEARPWRSRCLRRSPSARAHSRQRRPAGRARRQRRGRTGAIAQSRELRIESLKERLRTEGRPTHRRVHRLVAGGADAAHDLSGLVDAGQQRRHEVGELHPARGRVEHVGRDLQAVPDLRPPPLRGVRAADRREQLRRMRARARSVIAAASAGRVWSFQSQACAARLSRQRGSSASGRAGASTGSGVDPVVSTPMPITRSRANAGSRGRLGQRAGDRCAQALDVVGRVLPREVRIARVRAARRGRRSDSRRRPLRRRGRPSHDTTMARTELVPKSTPTTKAGRTRPPLSHEHRRHHVEHVGPGARGPRLVEPRLIGEHAHRLQRRGSRS